MNDDMMADLNEDTTEARNKALDANLLRGGDEVAGMILRPITAGDFALMVEAGVNVLLGQSDSIPYDIAAVLYCQTRQEGEMKKLAYKKGAFRVAVIDYLYTMQPWMFEEATPKVLEAIQLMNKARTAVRGEASGSEGENDPKAGDRAG